MPGHFVVGKHQVSVHALEHVLCCRAHVVVREVHFLDDARQVRETAAVVRAGCARR